MAQATPTSEACDSVGWKAPGCSHKQLAVLAGLQASARRELQAPPATPVLKTVLGSPLDLISWLLTDFHHGSAAWATKTSLSSVNLNSREAGR